MNDIQSVNQFEKGIAVIMFVELVALAQFIHGQILFNPVPAVFI